jgi:hypothetical protein
MSISKINLADLKESNINQLVATEMLMIRGGCDRGRRVKNNKYGRDSYSNKDGGCTPNVIPPSTCSGSGSSVSAPVDIEVL